MEIDDGSSVNWWTGERTWPSTHRASPQQPAAPNARPELSMACRAKRKHRARIAKKSRRRNRS